MTSKNIPGDIKSKSLKEATEEIDLILTKLESEKLDLNGAETEFKRLIALKKHIENLFKKKSKEISSKKEKKQDDEK